VGFYAAANLGTLPPTLDFPYPAFFNSSCPDKSLPSFLPPPVSGATQRLEAPTAVIDHHTPLTASSAIHKVLGPDAPGTLRTPPSFSVAGRTFLRNAPPHLLLKSLHHLTDIHLLIFSPPATPSDMFGNLFLYCPPQWAMCHPLALPPY